MPDLSNVLKILGGLVIFFLVVVATQAYFLRRARQLEAAMMSREITPEFVRLAYRKFWIPVGKLMENDRK